MNPIYSPPPEEIVKRRRQLFLAGLLVEAPLLMAGVIGYLLTGRLGILLLFIFLAIAVMGFAVVRYVAAVIRTSRSSREAAPAAPKSPDIVQ